MGAAWLDVVPDGDVEAVLADLRTGEPVKEPAGLQARLGRYDAGTRIELYSDRGEHRLGDLVAGVLRRTGLVRWAVVYLDHDEYGAEHIVLAADRTGTVHRVHHVFVHPDDEGSGQPSMTLVPAAPGTGPGAAPGAVIDDAAARAMVAELFGVPAESMRVAAELAARADQGLLTAGEPPSAWLDAFGVAWPGSGSGPPLNLRPGPVWRDAVARDVVPRLPGQWLARDYDLVRLPAAPVLCRVVPGRWSGYAVITPLYVPGPDGSLQFSIELRSAAEDSTGPVEPLLEDLTGIALPFFDRYGHPDGLRQLCRERVTGVPADRVNPHDLRCLAASEVVLGRYAEAAETYAVLARLTAADDTAWVREIAQEAHVRSVLLRHDPAVVHEALTATIEQQETLT